MFRQLAGYSSHFFNLVVSQDMFLYWIKLSHVRRLISKPQSVKRRARLRTLSEISPVVCNNTHCFLRYELQKCYIVLSKLKKSVNDPVANDVFTICKESDITVTLWKRLENLDSVTKCLKTASKIILKVCALIGIIIQYYYFTTSSLNGK